MPEELATLVDALDEDQKQTRSGFIFHTGAIGRHEVVLVASGIGKVMSALAVSYLVQLFEVDAIINSGSAGAVSPSLKVGDVVLADKLAYHDVDVTAFGYNYGQMAGQPLYYESSSYFLSEMKKLKSDAIVGLIVSGDSFVTDTAPILDHFPAALATEMEGASIAQAASSLKKPFLIIRAISDTADHEANVTFDAFIDEAGKKSATTLIQLLEQMV